MPQSRPHLHPPTLHSPHTSQAQGKRQKLARGKEINPQLDEFLEDLKWQIGHTTNKGMTLCMDSRSYRLTRWEYRQFTLLIASYFQ